jgi:uncharacterized protein
LILYLDASALVKRYLDEEGSAAVLAAMVPEAKWSMCRVGYVETARAVALGGESADIERLRCDWSLIDVIEIGKGLAEHAAGLASSTGLGALDALHLAAALTLPRDELTFATWDTRLHRAAREHGLRTLPAGLA